jgi:hypothetical protein
LSNHAEYWIINFLVYRKNQNRNHRGHRGKKLKSTAEDTEKYSCGENIVFKFPLKLSVTSVVKLEGGA